MLKANKNTLLLTNKNKLDVTICIIKNNQEQFLVEKEKLYIFKYKIDRIIKKHNNKLLKSYLGINKTLRFL